MLNDRERIAMVQQFGRTYRAFMSAFESRVGQPLPRWRVLIALYAHGGMRSQRQLVEYCRVDPGALTRQVKALEALNWVERRTDERDNRVTNVTLTEAGREVVETGMPHRDAFLKQPMLMLETEALLALSRGLAVLDAGVSEIVANQVAPGVADPVE